MELKFKMFGTVKRYLCRICGRYDLKSDLERCNGMCNKCCDEQDVYQIFTNGKFKKVEIDNLWGWLMEDGSRKLYGIFLIVYKNHKGISLVRMNGCYDDNHEFVETELFQIQVKTINEILQKIK